MLHSITSVAMHLLKYHCKQPYRMLAIILTLMIYLNSVVSDSYETSAKKEVNKNEGNGMNWDNIDGAHNNENDQKSTQILSRKRRYLTFPSGSSFQLVYDLIVGVVDYTNYLILGVTSALAWQLPSEPPSEILENLRDKLTDGTLGTSRNDTIESIKYVDPKQEYQQQPVYITSGTNPSYSQSQTSAYYTSNKFHPPMKTQQYSSSPVYYSQQIPSNTRKQDTGYYSMRQNPLTRWKDSNMRKVSQSYVAPKSLSTQSLVSKFSQWWNKKPKEAYNNKEPVFARKHRIFPVFAKRSVDAHSRQKRHGITGPFLTKIDNIHLRYHRSTRQDLYHKIARYLETHNKNGHECVLKALCETGQKGNEVEPGTFIGEIMRTIFTIPESEGPVHSYKHKLYDDAHAHDGSCVDRYPLCPDSVWKADFVL